MTKEEVKKALPEMVMFAKSEEERNHFKKLQTIGESSDDLSLEDFTADYVSKSGKK